MQRCNPRLRVLPSVTRVALLSTSLVLWLLAVARADDSPLTAAVPKGEVTKYSFEHSKLFPGTVRDYWVYVPKYDPAKPACVHVNQDGIQYNAPAVFDALIAKKEMPVTIGVFVMHGRVKATSDQALDRFNRSYEYDGLGDNYARFLLEELLPDVEKEEPPPTAGRSGSRTTATTARSPAPAAGRFAPSPRPGSGPTPFAASSARSAPTSACAAATTIRR